jgi:hypothetical protein
LIQSASKSKLHQPHILTRTTNLPQVFEFNTYYMFRLNQKIRDLCYMHICALLCESNM